MSRPTQAHFFAPKKLKSILPAAVVLIFACNSHAQKTNCQSEQNQATPLPLPSAKQQKTEIHADTLTKTRQATIVDGDVHILQHNRHLRADQAIIKKHHGKQQINLSGNIRMEDPNTRMSAQHLQSTGKQDTIRARQVHFQEKSASLRGFAQTMSKNNNKITQLRQAYFTSCPQNNEIWRLQASSIRLNYNNNQGQAKHIVLDYQGIPVFYSPFFFFPLGKERSSGFLAPTFNHSARNGYEITVPYYFNIAPNMDNTLSVRALENSGLMINNEFRLLTRHTRWTLNSEYLSEDRISKQSRNLFKLNQSAQFGQLAMNMNISTASDKDYFADFGNSLAVTNLSHLKQTIHFRYPLADSNLNINFLSYQTLDANIAPGARPYQLLPRVEYRNTIRTAQFDLPISLQWSHFYRPASVTGDRFHFRPSLQGKLEGSAWQITPKLMLDSTLYRLQNNGNNNELSRSLPVFSLDSRLFLEKNISPQRMQLLEPRLYYLWVPYQQQNHFPLFDSARNTLNFEQLYRENSFSGLDRFQNANQITTALSLKEINPLSGKTRFQLQSGIIHYFDTPKVRLGNEPLLQQPGSNLLLQWDGYLPQNTQSQLFLQFDPFSNKWIKQTAFIRYNNKHKIVNISWNKYATDELLGISAYLPLIKNWQVAARYDYSQKKNKEILSLLGFEYDNCCFQFRIAYNRGLNVSNNLYNETTTFELVFKGLSQPASGIGAKWQQSITGYKNTYQSY